MNSYRIWFAMIGLFIGAVSCTACGDLPSGQQTEPAPGFPVIINADRYLWIDDDSLRTLESTLIDNLVARQSTPEQKDIIREYIQEGAPGAIAASDDYMSSVMISDIYSIRAALRQRAKKVESSGYFEIIDLNTEYREK